MRRRSDPAVWPLLTLALAAVAAGLQTAPALVSLLEYDRGRIGSGELWRMLTGHWVHWSLDHLGWNLLVWLGLGAFWELRGHRRELAICALAAPVVISLAMLVFLPEMERYRGLSGVGCALVVGLAAAALGEARAAGRRGLAQAFGVVLGACVLKVVFEMTTGATVFVDAHSAGFVAVPLAHLVGGAWGWLVGPSASAQRALP